MTEVPLPVKFLFILIGPAMEEYLEIGRALSTLFSTPVSDNIHEYLGVFSYINRISEIQLIKQWIVVIY